MITAEGITKSYGDLKVLRGIDISVSRNEVVAMVGASGAGKTTLLQILGTLDRPDSGMIMYNGTDISRLKGRQLASFRNLNIGFVYIAGKSKSEAEGKASELLGFLNLADRLDHKPSELSGGEQQRVAVARALINNPSVILADEPSGNLDSANKNELHKLFFSLRDTFGQTILIVTHDRELAGMSDRILRIKDGVMVNE